MKIELMNGYTISGENDSDEIRKLVGEINEEMVNVYAEFEDEGESRAMDERDVVVYEYEDRIRNCGFKID
jgi:vacuolar-type H+-ATPase subunit H